MNSRKTLFLLGAALTLILSACGRNMEYQPNLRAYEATPFFQDGAVNQLPPENTVSREFGNTDPSFLTGLGSDGTLADLPVPATAALMQRGQERYDIFCSVCHGLDGHGTGMAVIRGFPQPPSLHASHLQTVPLGYFVQVITNGFGTMYPYASRVPAADRWAIAAYIKALQLSQNPQPEDLAAAAARSGAQADAGGEN